MRLRIFAALTVVAALGFGSKYYAGPAHLWFNDYGAGVLYEAFWCLVFFAIFPRKKNIAPISGNVFAVTCALEFLQLWRPAFLRAARRTLPGQWLLGTTFVWWDFPHYALGCALGWALMAALIRRESIHPRAAEC
jgi:hypothetical protein